MADIPADAIIVRCTRCEEVDPPPTPSTRVECEMCQRPVWLSHETAATVERKHPGERLYATCVTCIPEGQHEVMHLPEQVRDLRARGVPDDKIAVTLACAEVAMGLTLEEAAEDIMTNPNGIRANLFGIALARTRAFVRSVGRST